MNEKLSIGVLVALGFLFGALLDGIFTWVGFMLAAVLPHTDRWANIWFYMFVLIGAVQLIWQVPVILFLRRKGHKALALGVTLLASLVALLNASCWGLLWVGKIKL